MLHPGVGREEISDLLHSDIGKSKMSALAQGLGMSILDPCDFMRVIPS